MKHNHQIEIIETEEQLFHLADGTQLEWVPTWEGILLYAPDDIRNDRPLRLWKVRNPWFNKALPKRYRLSEHIRTNRHSSCFLRPRVFFGFGLNGKRFFILRSKITVLCRDGFAIADAKKHVVDHINNIPMDDRPSNLQGITQKENLARSKRWNESQKLPDEERKRRRLEREMEIYRRRKQLRAIMPEASKIDIEMEIALEFNEKENGKE